MTQPKDEHFEELLERFIPTPPQNAQDARRDEQGEMPRHAAYRAFDRSLACLGGVEAEAGSGCTPARQRAFEIIREVLEDSGIPFPRANALAERCFSALGEIL